MIFLLRIVTIKSIIYVMWLLSLVIWNCMIACKKKKKLTSALNNPSFDMPLKPTK